MMLADRKLILRNKVSGEKFVIRVAISAPYSPAKAKGLESFAACTVHTGTQDEGEHEAYGVDQLQALGNGLTSIDFFLKGLATKGELTWEDGRPYDSDKEAPFSEEVSKVYAATIGKSQS